VTALKSSHYPFLYYFRTMFEKIRDRSDNMNTNTVFLESSAYDTKHKPVRCNSKMVAVSQSRSGRAHIPTFCLFFEASVWTQKVYINGSCV
jgi:hypothetical protein